MQTSLLTRLPSMTLAVMLTLVVAQGLVFSPEAHAAGGGKLEGTWLMEVTIVNCTTGAPLPASIMSPATPFCFWTTQKHLAVKRTMGSVT